MILEVHAAVDLGKGEIQATRVRRQLADELCQVPIPGRLAQERREPDPAVRRIGLEAAGEELLEAARGLVRVAVPAHERGAVAGCVEELDCGGDRRAHGLDVPEPGDWLHRVDVLGQVVGYAVREAAQLELALPGDIICPSSLALEPAKGRIEHVVGHVDGRPDRDPVGLDRVGDILFPEPLRHAHLCALGWGRIGFQIFTA